MKEITRSKKIIFKKYILSLIRMIVLYSIFSITSYAKEDYIETIVNNFPLRTNDSDSTVMANEWLITTATSKNGTVKNNKQITRWTKLFFMRINLFSTI